MNTRALLHLVDSVSAAAILGTLAGWLPPLAALAAIVWYAVQIWESKTVQAWVHRKDPPSVAAAAAASAEKRVEKLAGDIHTLVVAPDAQPKE